MRSTILTTGLKRAPFLGSIRNESIIPWDDDADVGMREADCWRFLQLDFERYGVEVVRTHETEYLQMLKFSFPGENHIAWVDIFPRRLEGGYYKFLGTARRHGRTTILRSPATMVMILTC